MGDGVNLFFCLCCLLGWVIVVVIFIFGWVNNFFKVGIVNRGVLKNIIFIVKFGKWEIS